VDPQITPLTQTSGQSLLIGIEVLGASAVLPDDVLTVASA